MEKIISDTVKEILDLSDDEVSQNFKELPEIQAFYFWSSSRGGKAIIINQAGERLIANSAVKFSDHLNAFIEGRRN